MILIEVIGIPYAGKTTLTYNIDAQLKLAKIPRELIQEYKISKTFYERNKLSFDVNYLRALHIAEKTVLSILEERLDVILVDRGIVDTMAWFEFFSHRYSSMCDAIPALEFVLCDLISRIRRYAVIWIDSDPIESTSRHGVSGRVVNLPNLITLRSKYELVCNRLPREVTLIKIKQGTSPNKMAQKILSELKILRS